MRAIRIPRIVVSGLAAGALVAATLTACVEKLDPCEEFEKFAEIYGGADCPAVDEWIPTCDESYDATDWDPQARQDFDWCVDCYRLMDEEPDQDCSEAPLGADCPTLLNTTLDASCF